MTDLGGDRDHIQSLERGFAVLQAFDEEHPRPSLAEIAAVTGYSRPAVRRLLLTLQRLGFVDNEGPRWSLTPRVLSIGAHYTASHALADIAAPHLISLCEQTGESASLGALDGPDAVYLARVPARRVVSITANVGTRVLAHASAMGRVLLAHSAPAVVERYLDDPGLRPLTPHTITDPERFRTVLAAIRHRGWALVNEEREIGLITVSAPVSDHRGAVVAAVSSSSSTGRSSPDHMAGHVVPLVVETAQRISTDIAPAPGRTSAAHARHEGSS